MAEKPLCLPSNTLWVKMFSPIVEIFLLITTIWIKDWSLFTVFSKNLNDGKVLIFSTSLLLICLHLVETGRKCRHGGLLYREASGQGIVVGAVVSLTLGLVQIVYSTRSSVIEVDFSGLEVTSLSSVYAQYILAMFVAMILYGCLYLLQIDLTFAAPVIMLSFGFLQDHFADTNLLIPLTSAILYVIVYLTIIKLCPRSFTIGEAAIVSQGLTLLLIDFTFVLFVKSGYGELLGMQNLDLLENRTQDTLFLSTLLACTFFVSVFLSPVFYCLAWYAKTAHDSLIYSTAFYIGGIMNVFAIFVPSCYITLGMNPVWYMLSFVKPSVLLITCYWTILLSISISVVAWNKSYHEVKMSGQIPNIVIRKFFHLIGVLIFVPGIYYEPNFTRIASGVAVAVLVILELVRIFNIYPFGGILNKYLITFVDERDRGHVISTHIYLVLGFSLPVWLFPFHSDQPLSPLLPYSGVIALGIGDSFASIVGRYYGERKIPGSSKTFIGTFACFSGQMFASLFLLVWYGERLSLDNIAKLTSAVFITSVMEAVTGQIDNLILSQVLYVNLFLCKV